MRLHLVCAKGKDWQYTMLTFAIQPKKQDRRGIKALICPVGIRRIVSRFNKKFAKPLKRPYIQGLKKRALKVKR
jgi:hypothetical protein